VKRWHSFCVDSDLHLPTDCMTQNMEVTFYSHEVAMTTNSLHLLIVVEYYLMRWEWRYLFLYANFVALFLSKISNSALCLNRMLQNVHLPLLPGTAFKTNVSYSVYCFCVLTL
jgi:hypothetical protein